MSDPFVGRTRELDSLDELLAAVETGDGKLALVSGEPGVGKSRLAEEVARARTVWSATEAIHCS